MLFLNFQILKTPRKQFYSPTNSRASYKSIDRNLKTASVAVLKSMEDYVTVTSFVAGL